MSASTAPARLYRPTARRAQQPQSRLRVLAAPLNTGRRLPFVGLCAVLLLGSLVTVLVINIALSRGSYDVYVLEQERTALAEREQQLSERLAIESSPARLSERARELGMIPNASPAFIRLSDGAVLGSPEPADPNAAPSVSAIPTAADLAAARVAAKAAATAATAPNAATAPTAATAPNAAGPVTEPPAMPPEQLAAEQAALEAAAAAAAAAPTPPVVGDGAVVAGVTP